MPLERAAIDEIATLERLHPYVGRASMMIVTSARLDLAADNRRLALHTLLEAAALARGSGTFDAITVAAVLVGVLADLGQPQAGATLAGVLTEGAYAPLLLLVTEPEDRQEIHEQLLDVRAQLGQERYPAAIAAGAAMSLDDIIDTMLDAIDTALAELS